MVTLSGVRYIKKLNFINLGHALTSIIEDALARRHRMSGSSVVWHPGLDHAGIATQTAVEKSLLKVKGQGRLEVGRVKFVAEVERWASQRGSEILGQLKRLGVTLDWDKVNYTMSQGHCHAVNEAFGRLYSNGLIYRYSTADSAYNGHTDTEVKDPHGLNPTSAHLW